MTEPAERAQGRRQRILLVSTWLMLAMQWIAIQAAQRIAAAPVRAVDIAQMLAPLLVCAGILRGFFGSPLWLDRRTRLAANDELTIDNRRRALGFGMICAALCVGLLSVLASFVQLDLIEVLHLVLATLVIPPVWCFVWLERRGSGSEPADAD